MNMQRWHDAPVSQRVHMLRWVLPLFFVAVVFVYQLGFTTYVHDHIGHTAHTVVEIIFYGLVGPTVTWLTLNQIGRWLGEKEEAERAARAHERYLASITEASADAILSLNTDDVIRSWNRGATLLFGYSAQEMIDQPLAKLLPPDAGAPSQRKVHWVHRSDPQGALRHYESVCLTKDGRQIVAGITKTSLQDDRGHTVGWSVILRDMTQYKARETALAEERARIARDLHDGLAQNLYFMGLKLDYIRKQVGQDPDAAVEELKALKQMIPANIRDVRRTIFALRPVDLAGLGFGPALRKYAQEFGEQSGLGVTLAVEGNESDLPPALEPVFFRLIQEGLNNIVKHANAHHAWVKLVIGPDRVGRLTIRDDGIGFDPLTLPADGSGKMGLRQMQERVTLLRGQLHVESAPNQGTALFAEIPL